MSIKILICDPAPQKASELIQHLEEKKYEVHTVHTGKDAQLHFYRHQYHSVIVDLETKNHSALMVLKYIKSRRPTQRIILTHNKDDLENEEVSEKDLKKFGATLIIKSPYKKEDLLEAMELSSPTDKWKGMTEGGEIQDEVSVELPDKKFSKLAVDELLSGNVTIFDLYIKLSEGKYLKILHRGDSFSQERINKYRNDKNVKYFYFLSDDRLTYLNFTNHIITKTLANEKIPASAKTRLMKTASEKYIEEIYMNGMHPQIVEEGLKLCDNMFNFIKQEKDLYKIMQEMEEYSKEAFNHQFIVAFISGIVCKHINWASKYTTDMLVQGALLHDIGKVNLPETIREKKIDELNDEELIEFNRHPEIGAEIVSKFSSLAQTTRFIVSQHHEHGDGSGFPKGLTTLKIFPMANIVSNVNNFVDFMVAKKTDPTKALKALITDKVSLRRYDPDILRPLAEALQSPELLKKK